MANLIQLKRASNYNVSENPGSQTLAEGELAWNNKGDTLWIGKRIATTGTQFNLKRLNPVIQGTSNEIEVTASAADAINHIAAGETLTVGLPNDVTVGNNLTVNGNCILGNATSDTVTIAGDLTVNGTTTTINSTTVSIDDKTFVLAADAADSNAADGAGIHVTDDIARFTYSHNGTKWVSSKPLDVTGTCTATAFSGPLTGNVTGNADTVTTNANLTGDITSSGNATSIAAGVIVNTDINASAAIAYSKMEASSNAPTWNQNTTGNAATATNVAYTGLTGTVPTWDQNTTGTASNVTGVVAVANGGTGNNSLTTGTVLLGNAANAITQLGKQAAGKILTSEGTAGGDGAVWSNTLSGITIDCGTY